METLLDHFQNLHLSFLYVLNFCILDHDSSSLIRHKLHNSQFFPVLVLMFSAHETIFQMLLLPTPLHPLPRIPQLLSLLRPLRLRFLQMILIAPGVGNLIFSFFFLHLLIFGFKMCTNRILLFIFEMH